jgi:hypothetical protein
LSVRRGNPRLRVLHASPGGPLIDVYLDASPAFPRLAYGEVSVYAKAPAGPHVATVYAAGGGGPGEALFSADLMLAAGEDYTMVALGRLPRIEPVVLIDSTAAPGPGRAKARALHASPDAPAVDIAARRGPILFEHVCFRQVTPFVEVPARMVDLDVRRSGSDEAIFSLPDYTLAEGSLYTFVALGLLRGAPGFMIMPLVETVEMRLPA